MGAHLANIESRKENDWMKKTAAKDGGILLIIGNTNMEIKKQINLTKDHFFYWKTKGCWL